MKTFISFIKAIFDALKTSSFNILKISSSARIFIDCTFDIIFSNVFFFSESINSPNFSLSILSIICLTSSGLMSPRNFDIISSKFDFLFGTPIFLILYLSIYYI